jgi:hypothetical protein
MASVNSEYEMLLRRANVSQESKMVIDAENEAEINLGIAPRDTDEKMPSAEPTDDEYRAEITSLRKELKKLYVRGMTKFNNDNAPRRTHVRNRIKTIEKILQDTNGTSKRSNSSAK